MRSFVLASALLCLAPATSGAAQDASGLGDPEPSFPPARRTDPVTTAPSAEGRGVRQMERERIQRERLREAMGDLLLMSRTELQIERDEVGRLLAISGGLTAGAATGVVGGLLMAFIPLECRASTGWFNFGPTCDADPGWLAAGLISGGVSAITMIASAIWLSRVERRRRLVDRAQRPDPLALDVSVDANGARATASVRF